MERKYKDRLKKLAKHLIEGKLGHKKFDFNTWNTGSHMKGSIWRTEEVPPGSCGYAGCAIGECPIVFKRAWKFDAAADPIIREPLTVEGGWWDSKAELSGRQFFGLDKSEFNHLFIPEGQNTEQYGGRYLGEKAKAKSVGKNILAFLERKAK